MTALGPQAKAMLDWMRKRAVTETEFDLIDEGEKMALSVPSSPASPGLRDAAREVIRVSGGPRELVSPERFELSMNRAIDALRAALEREEADARATKRLQEAIGMEPAPAPVGREEREDLEQFVRELDADMFVQYPIQPNESDELKRERARVRKNFDLLYALIGAGR